jgi:hypothetical protein
MLLRWFLSSKDPNFMIQFKITILTNKYLPKKYFCVFWIQTFVHMVKYFYTSANNLLPHHKKYNHMAKKS